MTREEILALLDQNVVNEAVSQIRPRKKPLLEAVFTKVVMHTSDTVNLVNLDPGYRAIPFNRPENPAPEYASEKYTVNAIEIPLLRIKKFLPPSELRKLSVLDSASVVKTIANYLELMKENLYQTYEILASKALSGTINHKEFSGGEIHIDFGAVSTYTPTATWDTASADILGDIKAMKEIISSATPHGDFALIIGTDVMSAMLKNPDIKDWLKYTQGQKIAENGTLYRLAEVDIIEVAGAYTDADGISKPYIPPKTAYLVARTALLKVFGPPEDINFSGPTDAFAYTAYEDRSPQGLELGVMGRFLPAVLTTKAIVKATVLP